MISFASLALRTTAISSGSQPKSSASSRRVPSMRGSSTRHMFSTGSEFVNCTSRISSSSTCVGAGEMPPLFRLIIVRSTSNAAWIMLQYVSSSATASGGRSPAMTLALKSWPKALPRSIGSVMPAPARPFTKLRRVVMGVRGGGRSGGRQCRGSDRELWSLVVAEGIARWRCEWRRERRDFAFIEPAPGIGGDRGPMGAFIDGAAARRASPRCGASS